MLKRGDEVRWREEKDYYDKLVRDAVMAGPEKLPPMSGQVEPVTECHDMVQHPSHYKRFGKEVIDIIRDTLGPEGFAAYCQGNEIKYRLRAGFKNDGSEDLAKAMKYYEFRTGCK